MPDYYQISSAQDRINLQAGKGTARFSVRYVGDRSVEARAVVVPLEGAEKTWLRVKSPEQCAMQPGQTQTFAVAVSIPLTASPGRYGMRLDVVSVANPDEEYGQGPSVRFDVEQLTEPQPTEPLPEAPRQQEVRVKVRREHSPWAIALFIFVAILAVAIMVFSAWHMFEMRDRFDRFPTEVTPPEVIRPPTEDR